MLLWVQILKDSVSWPLVLETLLTSNYLRIYWNNFIEMLSALIKAGIQIRDNSTNRLEETRTKSWRYPETWRLSWCSRCYFYFRKSICISYYPQGREATVTTFLQSEFSISFSGGWEQGRERTRCGQLKKALLALCKACWLIPSFSTCLQLTQWPWQSCLTITDPAFPICKRMAWTRSPHAALVYFSLSIFFINNIEISQ